MTTSKLLPLLSMFLIICVFSTNAIKLSAGANGGIDCGVCTFIVGMTEQLADVYNETVVKALDRLCNFLPEKLAKPCREFADYFAPILLDIITEDASPDNACNTLRFCNSQDRSKCVLFHQSQELIGCCLLKSASGCMNSGRRLYHRMYIPQGRRSRWEDAELESEQHDHSGHYESSRHSIFFPSEILIKNDQKLRFMKKYPYNLPDDPKICNLPGIKDICLWLDDIFNKHDPAVDIDHDGFSTSRTLRGTSWRGRDCNDNNSSRHPGARPIDNDVTDDSNCNGIYGSDPATKKTYEEEFCGNSKARGIGVLGDSISAHFHLPEEWFDSQKISTKVFKDLVFIVENEIDWPQLSYSTGHVNNSWPNIVHGSMDSLYKRLFDQNHCNHGDYQNIAVNGAESKEMVDSIMYRNQQKDIPMILLYALIGNDVCNSDPDTFAHMTTVQEMKNNSLKTLQYLDTVLPTNSYVMVSGLADGRVLYDSLHNRIHPVGRLRDDVTYSDLYDYLNCLQLSPCSGWLNSNETIRNMTTQHAEALSNALKEVVAENKFKHFTPIYYDCPIQQGFDYWVKHGGKAWQLIEPVDGFHSNTVGQALTAKIMWENIEKQYPEILGPVNPYNEQISKIFGNQSRPLYV